MKKALFLLFVVFSFVPLLADDFFDDEPIASETTPPSLVDLTALPSAVANNSVNVISGNYLDSSSDFVVSGPDPYALSHSYSSSSLEEGTLGNGWNFSHYHTLRVYQPEEINFTDEKLHKDHLHKNDGGHCVHGNPGNLEKNPYTHLYLIDPSGTPLFFKGDGWAKNFRLIKRNTGYTNVCSGELSGQTNIKNITDKYRKV